MTRRRTITNVASPRVEPWLALATCLLMSCATPTQVTLELTTNARCPKDDVGGDHLVDSLIIGGPDFSDPTLVETALTSQCSVDAAENGVDAEIGTLVFIPAETNEGKKLAITVIAGVTRPNGTTAMTSQQCRDGYLADHTVANKPCILARRRLGFVEKSSLYLPVLLDTQCIGVDCGADKTCANGMCVDPDVNCDEATGMCDDPGSGGSGQGGGTTTSGGGQSTSTGTGSTSTGTGSTSTQSTNASSSSDGTGGAPNGVGGSGAGGGFTSSTGGGTTTATTTGSATVTSSTGPGPVPTGSTMMKASPPMNGKYAVGSPSVGTYVVEGQSAQSMLKNTTRSLRAKLELRRRALENAAKK